MRNCASFVWLLVLPLVVPPREVGRQVEDSTDSFLLFECKQVVTRLPFPSPPVELLENTFATTRDGESGMTLSVRNLRKAPFDALAMVVEYSDESGSDLVQVPYVAATRDVRPSFHSPVHASYANDLEAPIGPGATVELGAVSPVTVPACPSQAQVKFLMARYGSAEILTWSTPGWRIAPIVESTSAALFSISSPLPRLPFTLKLLVFIDEQGMPVEFLPTDPGQRILATELVASALKDTTFFPALADGKPTPAKLSLVLRFIPQVPGARTIPLSDLPRASWVMFVEQDPRNPGKWFLWESH